MGEYHREPKLKGALSYLDQCIVDWDEEDLKHPFAYSWEGDNYARGYSPHLLDWSGETGECVLLKHVEVGYCDTSVNDCGTRGEVSTIAYPIRSLMKRTEKNEPTISYSGMISGE